MKSLSVSSLFLALVTLSACGTAVTGRNDPARVTFVSSSSLDETLACVVAHMTAINPWDYPFRALIVEPGRAYEVHPTREIMLGGEPIFVSIRKATEGSVVDGYSIPRFGGIFGNLEAACR